MLYEWNLKDAKKVWRAEAREEGHAVGHAEGHAAGHALGHATGLEEGHSEGGKAKEKFVLDLIDQGLSVEEIKCRLTQTEQN